MKLRLTEARIPALRITKPQEDLFHEPTPGAGLRITRRGRKSWFLLYSVQAPSSYAASIWASTRADDSADPATSP